MRAAYNRAQRLSERKKMMQAWADYLDGLKAGEGKTVVSIYRPQPTAWMYPAPGTGRVRPPTGQSGASAISRSGTSRRTVHARRRRWIICQFVSRPTRPRLQLAATVRTPAAEHILGARRAERAFKRADPCVRRFRRQRLIAAFASWPKFEHCDFTLAGCYRSGAYFRDGAPQRLFSVIDHIAWLCADTPRGHAQECFSSRGRRPDAPRAAPNHKLCASPPRHASLMPEILSVSW
jgi:hypothetical protein